MLCGWYFRVGLALLLKSPPVCTCTCSACTVVPYNRITRAPIILLVMHHLLSSSNHICTLTIASVTNFFPPSQNVLLPCTPCRPATQQCYNYGCNQTCASIDPYTFTFTLYNLSLSRGSYSTQFTNASQQQPGPAFPAFLPATYYVTVRAVSASGQLTQASSNGITVDTTPPVLTSPILHYDVAYSTSEAVVYQGSNSTILVTWGFSDPESGVVSYQWAVGSSPYGQDLQPFTSVGTSTRGMNGSFLGLLKNNVTYYATVRAYNGAGLNWTATSGGVTYISTSLNSTALALVVKVIASSSFVVQGAGKLNQTVLVIQTEDAVTVTWKNLFKDVKSICTLVWDMGVLCST